ncbi:hypothetical protein MP638_003051, partial [Amoeboaphelidium occidentale]
MVDHEPDFGYFDEIIAGIEMNARELSLPGKNKNFIYFPVVVNGVKVLACLDTMATHSFMSRSLASKLQLKVQSIPGLIKIAGGLTHPRLGRTEKVQVEIRNRKCIDLDFELIAMKDGLVVGMDYFALLGFGITNVPCDIPQEKLLASTRAERGNGPEATVWESTDQQGNLTGISPTGPVLEGRLAEGENIIESTDQQGNLTGISPTGPVLEGDRLYSVSVYRVHLMNSCSELMDVNASISGFCNFEGAIVPIDVGDAVPVNKRQYPVPFKLKPIVDDQIRDWVSAGVIRRAPLKTSWNNPLLVVPKRDPNGAIKGWRVCIDPRPINQMIKSVHYPLPLIREIFNSLKGSRWFSRLDLKSGFHQFTLSPEHQEVTTFTWNGVQYCFVGTPFGFKHVPAIFQRTLNNIFAKFDFVKVYIDDIIIHSLSAIDHIDHVHKVINRLTEVNLRLNPAKCIFGCNELTILGFRIIPTGITMCKEKLLQIENLPAPKSGKQVEKHLGFLNYFREIIPLYSKLTYLLERLRHQSSIQWTEELQDIYSKLFKILSSDLVLSFPDFEQPFLVATDASNRGIAGVLYQEQAGKKQYISFVSRSLSDSERGYGATKRELLAVVFALGKFRPYLWGTHFTLLTDHKALTFIFTQRHVNQMINNWLDTLLDFDFSVVHCPGILNVLPDRISRLYDADEIQLSDVVEFMMVDLAASTDLDIVVEDARLPLLEWAHAFGNFGAASMVHRIRQEGKTWPGIHTDAQKVVSKCVQCQMFNIGRHGFHPLQPLSASLPSDHIAIDLKTMEKSHSGFKYILVVVDVFTRFVFLFPLKNKTMPLITKTLVDLFCLVGFPKIIQWDNGKEFVNRMLKLLVHECAIDHRLITPYHPRANGLAERFVRTVTATILKCLKEKLPLWDKYSSALQYYMNTKVSELHGPTPFSLMFGRRSNALLDYSTVDSTDPAPLSFQQRVDFLASIVYPTIAGKIRETQKKVADKYNSSHRLLSFQPGAVVMALNDLRSSNLEQKYVGPFLVVRRTAGGVESRYESFYTTYKKAVHESEKTAFGVTVEDRKQGIFTVAAKMEKMCPFYGTMGHLLGERQNINPEHVHTTAKPSRSSSPMVKENVVVENITPVAVKSNEGPESEAESFPTLKKVNHDENDDADKEEGSAEEDLEAFSSLKDCRNRNKSATNLSVESESQESVVSVAASTKKGKRKSDFITIFVDDQAAKLLFSQEKFSFEKDLKQQELRLKQDELELRRSEIEAARVAKKKELQYQRDSYKAKNRTAAINSMIAQGLTKENIDEMLVLFKYISLLL